MDPQAPWADQRLRRARMVTLASLATNVWTSLIMPGIGLFREPDGRWVALGTAGIVAFACAHWGALYTVVTPWLAERTRNRLLLGFAAAAALSIVLVGPVGGDRWATWAWLGASIVGTAPLLMGRWSAVAATAAAVGVAVGLAAWSGGSIRDYALITLGVGLASAAVSWLQVWFWDLLLQAQLGRAAQARLAATEERLRFARDVHDLLGHNLSVIALKAELVARLAAVDADRAGREAADIQRLAAAALTEMREVVHGYRSVNLADQLAAVEQVLRASGVRCTVTVPAGALAPAAAAALAPVLREATTNVLRHSRAGWCTIDVSDRENEVRMTVRNDGATGTAPDPHSSGLSGLADRLADAGGALRTDNRDGVFTLEATVRSVP